MLWAELAETSRQVAGAAGRKEKIELLAGVLRKAAPDEIETVVAVLAGELRQGQIGVGWATLRDLPPPAATPSLSVLDADAKLVEIGERTGPGSQAARRALLGALFGAATQGEQDFLRAVLTGELRQGALAGLGVDAVAKAAAVPVAEVRRALMLRGATGPVARAALTEGVDGLRAFHLQVGRGLQPMLAQTAPDLAAAFDRISPAAVEWKLDGIRVQLHRDGDDVRVFTRSLDDITARVPEVVAVTRGLPVRSAVLDGEMLAMRPDGRPAMFQDTAGRAGSRLDVEIASAAVPLTPHLFDLLHLDGEDLLDAPAAVRAEALTAVAPAAYRVPRTVATSADEAAPFQADALERGHEGVVVKSLTAPYEAGRRGAGWLKVKPRHTLDLVVLAAEWGHGRRRGWLSNLHLGALDPAGGGFVMLGKTFKGLTDELLRWQTAELLAREVDSNGYVVRVRPELVVEIAFDGVQTSSRYPGGVTLRFARVLRYRPDKRPEEADTLDAVRALHPAGGPLSTER